MSAAKHFVEPNTLILLIRYFDLYILIKFHIVLRFIPVSNIKLVNLIKCVMLRELKALRQYNIIIQDFLPSKFKRDIFGLIIRLGTKIITVMPTEPERRHYVHFDIVNIVLRYFSFQIYTIPFHRVWI